MSSTRRVSKDSPLRQERFASSASLPKGLHLAAVREAESLPGASELVNDRRHQSRRGRRVDRFQEFLPHDGSRREGLSALGQRAVYGRIKLRRTLPESLEPDDLSAIAELLLPDSDEAAKLLLVSHALRSQGYVAALESGASRAKFSFRTLRAFFLARTA